MSCAHKNLDRAHSLFDRCVDCDTHLSRRPADRDALYKGNYWSTPGRRSTLQEQLYNVDVHKENKASKNEYISGQIKDEMKLAALEIGFAPGTLLRRLDYPLIFGSEVDVQYEAQFRKAAGPRPNFIYGYFPESTLPLRAGILSLIVAMDVFEHCAAPDEFLAECARLLVPGGQLLLMLPMMHKKLDKRFFDAEEHVIIHSRKNLTDLLMEHRFHQITYGAWTIGHETVSAFKQ